MAEKSGSGLLTKIFTHAAKVITIGVVAAIAWQVILDPIFFPAIHGYLANPQTHAYVNFMQDVFGWIPETLGLVGDGGLLNTEFAKSALQPWWPTDVASVDAYTGMAQTTDAITQSATTASAASASGGVSPIVNDFSSPELDTGSLFNS